ncbi:MAG: ATP-binding cassette domain-containing protein [Pseudomonadota bacterium]
MLELRNVSVSVGDKLILQNVNLTVNAGEVHVLLGPNGSGKSSILAAIMGLPPFEVTEGEILYSGQDIGELDIDERARLGLGLAFQHPPDIDGVTVAEFAAALGAGDTLTAEAEALNMADFPDRDLIVGFSGGEIKRWEVLKLFLQSPDLLLFDEPESGVDLEHIAAVGAAVDRLVSQPAGDGSKRAALLITHTGLILEHVHADHGHIINHGQIIHSGAPHDLFRHIQRSGYVAPASEAIAGETV